MSGQEVDYRIGLAIEEAVTAGVFRRAERLNPHSAEIWESLAAPHSQAVQRLLTDMLQRPDAGGVGSCACRKI